MRVPFKVEKKTGRKQDVPVRITRIKKVGEIEKPPEDMVTVPVKKIEDAECVKKEIINAWKKMKKITEDLDKETKELMDLVEGIKSRAEKLL